MKPDCCSYFDAEDLRQQRFTSCDGKVFTDSELKDLLEKAIEEEKYEWASVIRDELKLRQKEKLNQ